MKKSSIAAMMACVLAIGCGIGGTVAWLIHQTDEVVNTFTVGNIDITLKESDSGQDEDQTATTNEYKMVPGNVIEKDPKVTVEAGSEACWLFIKVTESCLVAKNDTDPVKYYALDDFVTYVVDENDIDGWKKDGKLPDGVYYREVAALTADGAVDKEFHIIGNRDTDGTGEFVANEVLVSTEVTKEMMDAMEATDSANWPKLTFKACAVQKDNMTLADAWTIAQPLLDAQ